MSGTVRAGTESIPTNTGAGEIHISRYLRFMGQLLMVRHGNKGGPSEFLHHANGKEIRGSDYQDGRVGGRDRST